VSDNVLVNNVLRLYGGPGIQMQAFGGGERAEVPPYPDPTSERTCTYRQLRTSKDLGMPLSAQTRRVVFGIDYVNPTSERIRINAMEIVTDEPETTTQ
jgi:hypothetical protein